MENGSLLPLFNGYQGDKLIYDSINDTIITVTCGHTGYNELYRFDGYKWIKEEDCLIKGDYLFYVQDDLLVFFDGVYRYDSLTNEYIYQPIDITTLGGIKIRVPTNYVLVDDDNQLGTLIYHDRQWNGSWGSTSMWQSLNWNGYRTQKNAVYQWAKRLAPPPLYTWQSVPSISGKNGILSCTYIEQEAIGDATDGWINREYITEGTHCDDLFAGMNQGTVYNFMETVDGYRLVVRRYDDHYTIGLKVGDDVDWADNITVANLGITSIGFVIDPENQVGKFFKCYLSSEAGVPKYAVLYSPVMTLPNIDTLLEHVYTYVQGGESGDGPDEIDPDDGGSQQQSMPDTAVSGITTPTKSALETGFVTMYEMSGQQLTALAIYMWTTDFIEWLKKLYNDPKDVIVGLSIMPYPPLKSDTPTHVYAGNVTTSVNGYPLTNQYRTITFGTLKLKKEFYDFCDYSPFTKASISIPYCGSHELNMSDVIGCKLTLKYIFDYLTGTCVAEIDVKKDGVNHPRYFFTGNCAFKIPISSGDYGSIYSSLLSAGATIGASLSTYATVGAGGELALEMAKPSKKTPEEQEIGPAGAISAGASAINSVINARPSIEYTNGGGSLAGILSHQGAFLTIERPIRKKDNGQDGFLGRTSLKVVDRLGDCEGYTKVMKAHLDGINCYNSERDEIERWLLSGVRFEKNGTATPTYTPSAQGNIGVYLMVLGSDKDVIGKTWTNQTLVEGKLLYGKDVLNPMITFTGNQIGFSYAYIPLFSRFYYIVDVTIEKNSMTTVSMKCDVLQSHKSEIENCGAMLDRQESLSSGYINDPYWWCQQNTKVITVPFEDNLGKEAKFKDTDQCYILTMSGPGGYVPPEPEEAS